LIDQFFFNGEKHYLLYRHGRDHHLLPHAINYRANVIAIKKLGVKVVLATAAVGSLRKDLAPGTFLIPDQLIDWTRQRPLTFFDGAGAPVAHLDFSQPFCPRLRERFLSRLFRLGFSPEPSACYACTEGPRYETGAEVKALAALGADIVGMTVATEAVLFREAEVCYAVVAVVANYAAGISPHPLTHHEVETMMQERAKAMADLLALILADADWSDCSCQKVWDPSPEPRHWLFRLSQ
ncbi:MAG: MTAP family purine nucleoside phosphorylase, partial [Armatimonadetes bacterium]|nr:MTAP family purine nucleoside phosphorylase [Armatimonadota bacterium]MDW8123125.1 MTAP family purine nucleoside phosphorylase [Armatimonadota bacterium]